MQDTISEEQPKCGRGRGFASMSSSRVREVASLGGKAAHAAGTAHVFSSEEAQIGGSRSRRGKGKQAS